MADSPVGGNRRQNFLRMIGWWSAILVLAILNGALREQWLVPSLGAFSAQLASGLILSLAIFVVAYVAVPGFGQPGARGYWVIGAAWLVMTLVFEFSFGLYVQRREMAELLQAYTFRGGNIWPLVLASALVAPPVAAWLRRAGHGGARK